MNNIAYGILKTKIKLPILSKQLTYFMLTYNGGSALYKDLIIENNIDDILTKAAKTNKQYLLIQEEGHIVLNYKFFELLNYWINNTDFFITGHIIDYKNRDNISNAYYGLHTQCLLINLDYYRKLDCPFFNTKNNKETLINAIRHKQNIHDDYTPLALKKDKGQKEYSIIKNSGSNIISCGLEKNLKIYNWIPDIRVTKKYLYKSLPKKELDIFYNTLQEQIEINKEKIFFYPTESYNDIKNFNQQKIDIYIFPASSFKPNHIVEKVGFDFNTKIIYYDYSLPALAFKKYLISYWNGIVNYNDFIKNSNFYKYNARGIKTYKETEEDLINKELSYWDNFSKHWKEYTKLEHEYVHIDILNNLSILDKYNNKNIFLWISNIFHTLASHHLGYEKAKKSFIELLYKCYNSNNNYTIAGTDYFSKNIYVQGNTQIKELLDEYNKRTIVNFQDRK